MTSPTGVTYGIDPAPEPEPARSEPRRSTFESHGSQSDGVGSDFSSSDGDPDAGYSSPFRAPRRRAQHIVTFGSALTTASVAR